MASPRPGDSAGTPDEPTEVGSIMQLLERFNVQADHFVATAGESHDLNRSDLRALSVLRTSRAAGATASPSALAAALNLSTPATSALLDRLSRSGHVIRRRGATDGRRVELEMTESAYALSNELFAPLREHLAQTIETFGADERALIGRFLDAVTEATVQARERQTRS